MLNNLQPTRVALSHHPSLPTLARAPLIARHMAAPAVQTRMVDLPPLCWLLLRLAVVLGWRVVERRLGLQRRGCGRCLRHVQWSSLDSLWLSLVGNNGSPRAATRRASVMGKIQSQDGRLIRHARVPGLRHVRGMVDPHPPDLASVRGTGRVKCSPSE